MGGIWWIKYTHSVTHTQTNTRTHVQGVTRLVCCSDRLRDHYLIKFNTDKHIHPWVQTVFETAFLAIDYKLFFYLCTLFRLCWHQDYKASPSPREHKQGSASWTVSPKPSVSCYIRHDPFTYFLNSWNGGSISLADGLHLSFNSQKTYIISAAKCHNGSLN